jgi:hypothetical protein
VWGRLSVFEQLSDHARNCAVEKYPSITLHMTVLEVSAIAVGIEPVLVDPVVVIVVLAIVLASDWSHERSQHWQPWKQWKQESK